MDLLLKTAPPASFPGLAVPRAAHGFAPAGFDPNDFAPNGFDLKGLEPNDFGPAVLASPDTPTPAFFQCFGLSSDGREALANPPRGLPLELLLA